MIGTQIIKNITTRLYFSSKLDEDKARGPIFSCSRNPEPFPKHQKLKLDLNEGAQARILFFLP